MAPATMSAYSMRWASPNDWEKHRAVIAELYEVQNKTLSDVMKVMEEQYRFYATPRMYKTRFNKWGLQKTLRFQQVGELLRQNTDRAAEGKDSIRLIRGKQIDDRRLKKYLRSLPADRHNLLAEFVHGIPGSSTTLKPPSPPVVSVVTCRTPSPGPPISHLFPLRPPEHLRMPEECINSMSRYVGGAVNSGLWTLDPAVVVRAGPLFGVWNLGRTAVKLLKTGQTKQAFQVLHNCFHEYKALLLAQSPVLFLYTYVVGLGFADGYPELYMSFLRYIRDLSRIVHAENHPLHKLFANMYRMGPDLAKRCAVALTQAYMDLCQLRSDSIAMLDIGGFLCMHFAEIGIHGHDVVEATLRDIMLKLEPHRHDDVMEAIWVDARDDLARTLMRLDRYEEAADVLRVSLESRILPKYPLLQASAYRNLFLITKDTGSQDEAVRAGHMMITFANDIWGMTDSKTITLLADFVAYLRKIEMDELADRIDADFDAAMEELSQHIDVIDFGI